MTNADSAAVVSRKAMHMRTRQLDFRDWLIVAQALHGARVRIIAETGVKSDASPTFAKALAKWVKANKWASQWMGDGKSSFRSASYWLVDNLDAVEAWRSGLSEPDRERWSHPETLKREFRRAHLPPKAKLTVSEEMAALRGEVLALKAALAEAERKP
jgi:hypothetical protein